VNAPAVAPAAHGRGAPGASTAVASGLGDDGLFRIWSSRECRARFIPKTRNVGFAFHSGITNTICRSGPPLLHQAHAAAQWVAFPADRTLSIWRGDHARAFDPRSAFYNTSRRVTMKPRLNDLLWLAAGAAIPLAFMLLVLRFHGEEKPAEQLALKAKRIELVAPIRLALATASEAEKSAVLATTDEESRTFADQARAAGAAAEQGRKDLDELLRTGGTQEEEDLLAQFSQAFAEFQRIDNELLDLAVKNTNLKAYSLAFGPAAETLNEMDTALSHLLTENATSPDASKITALAHGAQIDALRMQVLLAPHIAEESDQKMDEMEAAMARHDQNVRKDLEGLSGLPTLSGNPDLQTTISSWKRFTEIKVQILALSRENTNVRSLTISLNRKRRVMLMCQDALAALQKAIEQEPITDLSYGRVHPR
jgi:hypothetical protein